MYESYFGLSQRPFAAAPNPEFYIATRSLDAARQTLVRCVERAEGAGLVVGAAGTGKSLLCQIVAKHFRGQFQVCHLAGARLGTRRALLQNILFELKLPYRDMDEGELRLSLIDHLEPRSGGPSGLLLLVDEAHMLPLRLLEEVRLLTNVVRDGQSRVRIVLTGNMALEERLTAPKLESFHQRISGRCYLQPLGRDETIFYLQEQIRRCGAIPDGIFTADAQAAVHTASDGIPRLINQICDHALTLAALGGQPQIDAAGIEEAWADLQQLPIPVREPPALASGKPATSGGTIEFGQLADEPGIKPLVQVSAGDAAVAKLDAISRSLDTLQTAPEYSQAAAAADLAGDFAPAVDSGTEVELFFHGAHDPFGGQWEEEEVVIDRYASLEDAALRRGRVTSDDGRAIGAAVSAAAGQADRELDSSRESPLRAVSADDEFQPSDDPLLPEEQAHESQPRRTAATLRAVGQDDRDIIVVDEEQASRRSTPARPRRQEYRQLFSKLKGN
jgi:type II secretory pathway predicted ATPase ExeA